MNSPAPTATPESNDEDAYDNFDYYSHPLARVHDPTLHAALTIQMCRHPDEPRAELEGLVREMRTRARAIVAGSLNYPETLVTCQATVLDVLFGRLTTLALSQIGRPNFDALMRVALRAQQQSLRTLNAINHFHRSPNHPKQFDQALRAAFEKLNADPQNNPASPSYYNKPRSETSEPPTDTAHPPAPSPAPDINLPASNIEPPETAPPPPDPEPQTPNPVRFPTSPNPTPPLPPPSSSNIQHPNSEPQPETQRRFNVLTV